MASATEIIRQGRILAFTLLSIPLWGSTRAANFDIVYVRQPRFGDASPTLWADASHPARLDPGADLMLLHPDGTEEVLVAGGNGAVADPVISFDGQSCYYVKFPDLRIPTGVNKSRQNLPILGADIYRINLKTRAIDKLTKQDFTPNTGTGKWSTDPVAPPAGYNSLGYGILNTGPCPLPGGKIAFTSNRNGFLPTKPGSVPCLQLFVMDEDGENIESITPMSFGSVLHPMILQNGRIIFSSYESEGLRDLRQWGLWSIQPDGRHWQPEVSAFDFAGAFHFQAQLGSGDLVIEDYYFDNNGGFGSLFRVPPAPAVGPAFYDAFGTGAPPLAQAADYGAYSLVFPFQRVGTISLTPFTTGRDRPAPFVDGKWVGKFTHPSAAPNNDLLVAWTPTPANNLNGPSPEPYYDSGIYVMPGGNPIAGPEKLTLIKNSPNYNEVWPKAVVSYKAIHGILEPPALPWLPNDGKADANLPVGTPYGLIGTSGFYKRESFPGFGEKQYNGLDPFNTDLNNQSNNWFKQGAEDGLYSNSDIWAVRVLGMEPNPDRASGPNAGPQFYNHVNERLRILGEIPLRKFDDQGAPILDPEGNPDTSFLAKVPSDTPFTFQTLDRNGMVLNMAQTWHQVRPGEARYDCGGCHAHSKTPLKFELTAAGKPGFKLTDLTQRKVPLITKDPNHVLGIRLQDAGAVNVEFLRDIRPILTRSCVPCHSAANPQGSLVLDDLAIHPGVPNPAAFGDGRDKVSPPTPGDYQRLAADWNAKWGYKPVVASGKWNQSNASRYIRMLQSRRSLLIWKIFGQRLDGWNNSDHPTETTLGDRTTLPSGANVNMADIDYIGDVMPPLNSNVPPLSEDEKLLFVRWVDLGCPINVGELTSPEAGSLGFFADDLRPTLTVSSPRQNINIPPLNKIVVGVADAYSGIQSSSLSITADFAVNGRSPGAELADLATLSDSGTYTIQLTTPIQVSGIQHLDVKVADQQGNTTSKSVRFMVATDDLVIGDIDLSQQQSGIVRLLVFNARPELPFLVRGASDLQKMSAGPQLPFEATSPDYFGNQWVDVQVGTTQSAANFFRLER